MELTKHVTQDDMTLYSGPGNIHSDVEVANAPGCDAPIAQGMMTLAYASELMTKVCGDGVARARRDLREVHQARLRRGHGDGDRRRRRRPPTRSKRRTRHGDVLMVGTATLRG